jgi:hypothetical protein
MLARDVYHKKRAFPVVFPLAVFRELEGTREIKCIATFTGEE